MSNTLNETAQSGAPSKSLQTYVLATNGEGQKELHAFDVPVGELSHEQLLHGEHHDRAIAMARRLARGLKEFVVFDESSPAAAQMRQIVQASAAQEPARVVLQVEGGLIHDITADRPVSVLILDADVEGASASDVTLLDAVRDAVYIRLDEIDSQHALKSRDFVGQAFEQAHAFLDGHPLALPREPQR